MGWIIYLKVIMPRKKKKNYLKALDAALPAALLVLFVLLGYLLFAVPSRDREMVVPTKPPEHAPVETALKSPEPLKPKPPQVPAPSPTPRPVYKARVAIVIDDLGSDMASLEGVLGIDAPLSVAVLPDLPYSARSAIAADDAGRDVLLHLPMQPHGDSTKGLGPGALMKGMDGQSIARTVEADLSSVPGAIGVNNHMGSYLTEDSDSMSSVMDTIGRRGLFFIDSKTSSASVALRTARLHGVRSASRNVFLDDTDDEEEIRKQFDRLIVLALKKGEAIAIGHPRPATLKVLKEEIPGLKEKGVELVRVSKLVRK